MLDLNALKPSNSTEEQIVSNLDKRKRFRRETNITRYFDILRQQGVSIVEDQYLATWKKWESLGLGSIIYGRKGNPTRFKWKYNLKWVAQAAKEGDKAGEPMMLEAMKKEVKRGRGRPKGSRNKFVAKDKHAPTAVLKQLAKIANDAQKLIAVIKDTV